MILKRVIITFCIIATIIFRSAAQENFVIDKIYFPNEVIRKVSVGQDAVWVIKGIDSSGVAKVNFDGITADYTSLFNLATNKSFTGIVGKYGDAAMVATKGDYLLKYVNGNITKLQSSNGILGEYINAMEGTPGVTKIATNKGMFVSFDNTNFYNQYSVQEYMGFAAQTYYYIAQGDLCFFNQKVYKLFVNTPSTLYGSEYPLDPYNPVYKITNIAKYGYMLDILLASKKGLFIRDIFCQRHSPKILLADTAVYDLERLGDKLLIGSESGLFYSNGELVTKASKIELNEDYQIFDINIESKSQIWLATNKGLIKIKISNEPTVIPINDKDIVWSKRIGDKYKDEAKCLGSDREGNSYSTGYFEGQIQLDGSKLIASNSKDYYLAKYNKSGSLIWVKTAEASNSRGMICDESGENLTVDKDGNTYVIVSWGNYTDNPNEVNTITFGSFSFSSTTPKTSLIKYSKDGDVLWVQNLDPFETYALKTDARNNLYMLIRSFNKLYNLNSSFGVAKLHRDGSLVWAKNIPGESFHNIEVLPNGSFYLTGKYHIRLEIDNVKLSSNRDYTLCLLHFNSAGKALWGVHGSGSSQNNHIKGIRGVTADKFGNAYITGYFVEEITFGETKLTTNSASYFLIKVNPEAKFEWIKQESYSDWASPMVVADSLGYSYVTGINDYSAPGVFIRKYDPNGNQLWKKNIEGISFIPNNMVLDNKNNIVLQGNLTKNISINDQTYLLGGESDIVLLKFFDSLNVSNKNVVRGRIFKDLNGNKKFDNGDVPLSGNIIKAEPGSIYSKSDENGNYSLLLSKGKFSITQIIPAFKGQMVNQIFPVNPKDYNVNLSSTNSDTTGFDFINEVDNFPFLSIDIASDRRRRCFKNNTKVEYCNDGFADAGNVEVKIEYPEYVIPVSSSIPWSRREGKFLIYEVGTLKAGECKSFILSDSVICFNEAIRGLTQCTKAYITPKNISTPDPRWDKSDIELKSICKENGFVRLIIKNVGIGNMSDSASYKIYLNTAIAFQSKYKLNSKDSLVLNVPANGEVVRLEAEMTPYHPGASKPSITIEGCGGKSTKVSKGFLDQLPQNDEENEVEIICLPILDSYDPNDKQVSPRGILDKNYISEDDELEYLIRFQNSGTDTAYRVVVRDELSEFLDISTLRVGAGSHSFTWTLSGSGKPIITWTFENINLPDSTTNEPLSHGFIKYKIKQSKDISKMTEIKNKAEIYFDYNSAIVTNEVVNTVGIPDNAPSANIVVQNCGDSYTAYAGPDENIKLCSDESIAIKAEMPGKGSGSWKIIKGSGKIKEEQKNETLVDQLAYGENILVWEVFHCDQQSQRVLTINRSEQPQKPYAEPNETLCKTTSTTTLKAQGSNIKWYSDIDLKNIIGEGNEYLYEGFSQDTLFITQTVDGCESVPHQMRVNIISADIKEIFMPNVITPNGDDKNDYFQLPILPKECFGEFKQINIFNRWGRIVFSSKQEHFQWTPDNLASGVYFYTINLSKSDFQGSISILR